MASVTQKVPSYVKGISTQPDEKKIPGQVVDLINGVPDVVDQLIKRPGSNLVNTISPSTASHTKWFEIYTDATEQYIGQVGADGAVKIWRCSDGVEIPVDYADIAGSGVATYLDNQALSDEKSSDIQVMTINETTFFVNRRKTVAMKTGASDKAAPQLNEAFINLDTISYGKQYALDIYNPTDNTTYTHTRATSLSVATVDDSSHYSGTSNGDCLGMGREVITISTGTDKCGTSPPNMSADGKSRLRYEMDIRCTPQPTGTVDDSYTYHDTYQAFPKLQFGGEGWTTNDTHQYTSAKGVQTTITVKNHVTLESRASIAMVRPQATSSSADEHVSAAGILGDIKTTLDAISGTGITATIVGNGIHLYSKDPFGVTSPEQQLMTITTTEANNIADLPRTCRHGYTVRVVNSGEDMDDYYLRFQAEGITADIVQTGTYARSSNTVTVTTASAHGLANGSNVILDFTSGAATDGQYTIASVPSSTTFTITDSASGTISAGETVTVHPCRYGEGVWEEVAAPGVTTTFDNTTMPLKLTRVLPGTFSINGGGATSYANGAFRFGYPDWGKRDVGDDITNAEPSFVGQAIDKMVFFRNRIALLSQENVILSRVNQFYNFWVKTAMAISNGDPIDLQASSTYPTKLSDAIETASGLVIFSANEQFLLSSGAEALLTPETAKVSFVSSYAFNVDTKPISLGTTIGFLNSTVKNARFFEMSDVDPRKEPQVFEQSKIVSKLLPPNITIATSSNENNLILFAVDSTLHTATNEVWGYRWYQKSRAERAQSAWFRWTLPNNVIFHSMMDDKYYAVLNTGSTYTLEKFDIKLHSDTDLIGTSPDQNRVHLDTKKTFASGDLTYNSATDVTTFTLGAGYYSSRTLTAYCITDSDSSGKSYDIPAAKITGTAPNQTVTLPGNWKTSTEAGSSTSSVNTDVVIGYEYEFEIELPKVYMTRQEGEKTLSETRGSLVIHRMNFDFGDVGVIDVTLKRRGRDDYTYTVESLEWDNVLSSTAAIASGYMHTIPVYDRNENLSVFIKSNHPSPATLFSMNWEGDYSPRYYQRV